MKKIIFSSVLSLITVVALASVSPVKIENTFLISPQSCTVTAFGIYQEPNDEGYTDVSCSKTAVTCAEASALAEDCRNQNVCRRVIANGYTPPSNLGCKTDVLVGP